MDLRLTHTGLPLPYSLNLSSVIVGEESTTHVITDSFPFLFDLLLALVSGLFSVLRRRKKGDIFIGQIRDVSLDGTFPRKHKSTINAFHSCLHQLREEKAADPEIPRFARLQDEGLY